MKQSYLYLTCTAVGIIAVIGVVRSQRAIQRVNANIAVLEQRIETFHIPSAQKNNSKKEISTTTPQTEEDGESVEVGDVQPIPETETNSDGELPIRVALTVPFTSQAPEKNWDQPWQDACEEAAILMLDAYYKQYNLSPLFAKDELQRQINWQKQQGWGGSIDIIDVQSTAAWYMNEPQENFTIIQYPKIEELKKQLAANHPILVVADGKVLPNQYFSGDGPVYHALIITGYDDTAKEFITNDPGTQFGEEYRYAYDDLMRAIHDWNGGEVSEGMPVVLVKNG